MSKFYRIFVSSTYEDLKEERLAISKALLEMDCMPTGMEVFPSASTDSLSVIKQFINECDLVIAIGAGRYGTIEPQSGKSYSELEWDYANSINIPCCPFLKDIGKIPNELCDDTPKKIKLRDQFHEKLKSNNAKFFNTPSELVSHIKSAVHHEIKTGKLEGWIRASAQPYDSSTTLTGVWELTSRRYRTQNNNINYLKVFTDDHYFLVWYDMKTREVDMCKGGYYTFEHGTLKEFVQFGTSGEVIDRDKCSEYQIELSDLMFDVCLLC